MTRQVSDRFRSPQVSGDGGAFLPSDEHPDIIRVREPYAPEGMFCRGNFAGSTACQRGYAADWVLKDKRLYLARLVGFYRLRDEQEPVFADWFSGWIVVGHGEPEGDRLSMIEPTRPEAAAFGFRKGVLTSERHWRIDRSRQQSPWSQFSAFCESLERHRDTF